MNGVPVKISENYKPPKKIAITQSVVQRLANPSATVQLLASTYDFTLERTVLAKMCEWQHVRAQENCDRKERMRLRLQERQKQIEAKQKQMLTAVSYPSADDFSSDDDRDEDNSNDSSANAKSNSVPISSASATSAAPAAIKHQQFSPPNYFDSILVPTVMPGQHGKNGATVLTPCSTKINYSDFENDTSSPFDNVELKTINDLDILAEVLNTSATIQDEQPATKESAKQRDLPRSTAPVATQQNIQNHNNVYTQQQQQQHPHQQQQAPPPQPQQMNQTYASYYDHSTYNHQSNQLQHAIPMYQPTNYNTATNIVDPKPKIGQYFYSTVNANPYSTSITDHSGHHRNPYIQNNYYNNANYNASTVVGVAHVYTGPIDQRTPTVIENPMPNKSKSKSVPDIMQEINDELKNSERKRARNNSQCSTSPADESSSQSSSSTAAAVATHKSQQPRRSKSSRPSLYHSLSESSQQLATNISSMGFPLERVARITEKLGRDDKKVQNQSNCCVG